LIEFCSNPDFHMPGFCCTVKKHSSRRGALCPPLGNCSSISVRILSSHSSARSTRSRWAARSSSNWAMRSRAARKLLRRASAPSPKRVAYLDQSHRLVFAANAELIGRPYPGDRCSRLRHQKPFGRQPAEIVPEIVRYRLYLVRISQGAGLRLRCFAGDWETGHQPVKR
jgi:hypothetical protein